MKVATLILVALALASSARAQTITVGPVPAGAKLTFETPSNVVSVSDALTFEARLTLDGTPLTAATSTSGLTCGPAVTPAIGITCQWVLTASNRDAMNKVGQHNLTVSMFRPDVGESGPSSPFVLTSPAGAPTGTRITP
jgi:hypothetical protein